MNMLRAGLILVLLIAWEAAAASGIFYSKVVPSLSAIGRALWLLLTGSEVYLNLAVTGLELLAAMAIGTLAGVAVGLALGVSRSLGRAFEAILYYIGPTPKIVFLPILIVMFGVGAGSKIAIGVASCFFPVVLSVAAGVRGIDKVLIRVGRSFNASAWQMVRKIYLPALVPPLVNGVRLGLGVGIIGILLAETVLSNRGLGFMAIQDYNHFQIADMYAILIVIFAIAIALNAAIARVGARMRPGQR
jgi:ABC-type nitrate/sulfonate/bicarbonate transport system permease component